MKTAAVVLGGYVNGYSIIKELHEEGVENIALFHSGRSIAGFSNKVGHISIIDQTPEMLLKELRKLNEKFGLIVVFPTDDSQVENLYHIREEIKDFCYLPMNFQNIIQSLDKYYQYTICETVNIPYPKSFSVRTILDLDKITQLTFPVLIKPSTRVDIVNNVFRNLYLETMDGYLKSKERLEGFVGDGIEFIVSEFIPGDDSNIYAYTCYRSQGGKIENEWTGKKLTQFPDNYGVFSSSSNEAPDEVLKQGRALVEALDAFGIVEPEFKYDSRDQQYKLMEVNFRSMMWHRTGKVSGVSLHKNMLDYAGGFTPNKVTQSKYPVVHFVYMLHEIGNLIGRKGYWENFKHNVWGGDVRVWAIYERKDIKPFIYSLYLLLRMSALSCLRRFGSR